MAATLTLTSSALAQDDPEGGEELGGDELGGDDLGGDESGGEELGGEEAGFEASSDDMGGGEDESATNATAKPISVGLLLGFGIGFDEIDPWGLGFGLRGGYNLGAIFLGARFVYYLGESVEALGVDASYNLWEFGIEGGYDLALDPIVIRPTLGLGLASLVYSVDIPSGFGIGGSTSTSEIYLAIAPGASVLFDVAENIFIGAEGRLQIVLAEETLSGLILMANGGMRF